MLRTLCVALLGRILLPAANGTPVDVDLPAAPDHPLRTALNNAGKRFKRRIRKIVKITVPIYIFFYALTEAGFFAAAERFMADHVSWLSWLTPQALSILTFQMAAEFTAGLAAAGSLMTSGAMEPREIVLVLLIGNVLSSPIRALRHQYPYYAGIFRPVLALQLIVCSQGFRALSLVVVALLYAFAL